MTTIQFTDLSQTAQDYAIGFGRPVRINRKERDGKIQYTVTQDTLEGKTKTIGYTDFYGFKDITRDALIKELEESVLGYMRIPPEPEDDGKPVYCDPKVAVQFMRRVNAAQIATKNRKRIGNGISSVGGSINPRGGSLGGTRIIRR